MAKNINNLPGFDLFNEFTKDDPHVNKVLAPEDQLSSTAVKLGFKCSNGDISRLNARYGLAKSFDGIKLSNYSEKTQKGYSALFQAFLTWSVYERYCFILDRKKCYLQKAESIFGANKLDALQSLVVNLDVDQMLFKFIESKADNGLKTSISPYLAGKHFNPLILIMGIRHIFAHGNLTAHANNAYRDDTIRIVSNLSEFVLEGISEDFQLRVRNNLLSSEDQ
ncbi:MAG: hypothetical protein WC383_11625 [Gammaproteobacteria bacterium]